MNTARELLMRAGVNQAIGVARPTSGPVRLWLAGLSTIAAASA
jgi:hypothetical protein